MNLTGSNRSIAVVIMLLISFSVSGQRKMEELNRGVLAVRDGLNNYIGWRIPATELRNVSYNVYRDGELLTTTPVTGASNYVDEGAGASATYTVTAIVDGVEQAHSEAVPVWSNQYMDIPVRAIDGTWDTYELNDASVGDLDGDGEYEVVVKRLALADLGSSNYHYLEAYELDGTFMWAINLGPNMHNKVEVNFLVYDFDEDGKAEIITRTSDGMIDGVGNNIGDRDGDGRIDDYGFAFNSSYYRIEGPDYISVFDGETGEELAWDYYIERDPLVQWGSAGMSDSQLGHRATKCMWTVAYLDGKHPSFVNGRGIYHRIKLEAWDWDGTNLAKRWAWDSSPGGVATAYHGQGNHQLSCADVDDDGCDEIVYGAMVVDNTGEGLFSTGFGHGDALHVSDMDPDRPGLEIWQCLEGSATWGATFRDAATGELLIRYSSNRDCGRCAAGDISTENEGFELWGATECPMYNTKGENVGANNVPMNFMIFWDGDKMREFQDHSFSSTTGIGTPIISKYDSNAKDNYSILSAYGSTTNNWTKGTPCLQADIFGDWREEMMVRTTDNTALRIYTTIDPTEFRMPTLMHEPQYRIAVAWQNNSYNQPPHTAIYLGNETEDAVPYPVINNKIAWVSGPNWGAGAESWIDDSGNSVAYSNEAEVLFDLTGDNSSEVSLVADVSPKSVSFTTHTDYSIGGTGKLTGTMELLKAGSGALTINNNNDYSGITKLYYGSIFLNGDLTASAMEVCMFGNLYLNGTIGNGLLVKSRGKFHVGNQESVAASAVIQNGLTLNTGSKTYIDLTIDSSGSNDLIAVTGDVNIEASANLIFNRMEGSLNPGVYDLITFDGTFTGDLESISMEGLDDVACELQVADGKLSLKVLEVRAATTITWTGTVSNIWDFAGAENWDNEGTADWFLGNDEVLFNADGSAQTTVDITEVVPVGSMTVDGSVDYTFNGDGSISGTGGLTKNGTGKLFINTINDFTGPVTLNGGLTEVAYISNAGLSGPLGAASADASNFVVNGSVLSITNTSSSTNRSMTIGDANATFYLASGVSMDFEGDITGTGDLIKDGVGALTLKGTGTHAATQVNDGTLTLGTEAANISGVGSSVTIKNTTLQMYNNSGSYSDVNWDLVVPSGSNATLNLDGRCAMYGSLTGAGTLNLSIPFIRSELFGDWSAFTGSINASTTANDGWLILGNTSGYGGASIYLGDDVTALYRSSNDVTIEIGELTGSSLAVLGSGGEAVNTITWEIGGKGTSFQYDGKITDTQFKNSGSQAAIIKAGSGRWTLTNANTYSGGTSIERGTIIATNTSGSATGTGSVEIMTNASLAGTGSIAGEVIVNSRGYLMPGLSTSIGTLTINNDVTINTGGRVYIKADASTQVCDQIIATGSVSLSGTLYMVASSGSFANGQFYKIIDAPTITGEFASISPATPGDGLYWDTSKLNSNGVISVSDTPTAIFDKSTGTSFVVHPNPSSGTVWLKIPDVTGEALVNVQDLTGRIVYSKTIDLNANAPLQLNELSKGIYLIVVDVNGSKYHSKLMIE